MAGFKQNSFWAPDCSSFNDEPVGVVILKPRHYQGEVLDPLSHFQRTKLKDGDVSMLRLAWTSPTDIVREVVTPAMSSKSPSRGEGVAMSSVEEILDIKDDANNSFFRFEVDGRRTNPSHINLGTTDATKGKPMLEIRERLVEKFWGFDSNSYPVPHEMACSSVVSSHSTHPILPRREIK